MLRKVYNDLLMQLDYAEDLTFSTWEVKQGGLSLRVLEFDYQLILKIQD